MHKLRTSVCVAIVVITVSSMRVASAHDTLDGCLTRPACGNVCKLVCETKKLAAVGYGYKCDEICIPACSRRGCKHCDTTCCQGDEPGGCPPSIEFCWYDWFACGCAKPRTVKLLTKFQAEREVNSYHWEVVDAACCDCVTLNGTPSADGNIYKPAPADAQLGDVLAVTEEEMLQLEPELAPAESALPVQLAEKAAAEPPAAPETPSIAERLQDILRR